MVSLLHLFGTRATTERVSRKQYKNQTVLVLYGGPNETHEAAFVGQTKPTLVEGTGVTFDIKDDALVANWAVTPKRKVLRFSSGLRVYLLGTISVVSISQVILTNLSRPL